VDRVIEQHPVSDVSDLLLGLLRALPTLTVLYAISAQGSSSCP
jgi:hypothetical protein